MILGLVIFCVQHLQAQKNIPSVALKNLDGTTVNTAEISKDNMVVYSFWATWCVPCINELDAIHEVYEEWVEETGVKLVAVSIDNSRTSARVRPMVNAKEWDYEILLDGNQDFKRKVNAASLIPYLVIVKEGKIVYTHTGYKPGSEEYLFEKIKELKNE